jgi:ribosomal protein L32E
MTEFRHHRASREIVFVAVPVAGSPEPLRRQPPPAYPRQEREAWRPARSIPVKQRKAQRLIEIMRDLGQREAEARRMLQPNAALMREWLKRAA